MEPVMDIEEFEARIDQIIRETGVGGGVDPSVHDLNQRKAQLDALEKELLKTQHDRGDALELLSILFSIRNSLTNPDFLKGTGQKGPREPAILAAIEKGDVDAVHAALNNCDVNARYGEHKETALYRSMSLMWGGSVDVMNFLLDSGADPKLGLAGCNVLHGLGFGNADKALSVETLLPVVVRCVELGAGIEQRTEKLGWTPLIMAVSEWNAIAAEVLLLAGADITAKAADRDGALFSGAGVDVIAEGNPETMAVIRTFQARQ